MTDIDSLQQALELPGGARFHKCALQVNPFAYLRENRKQTPFPNEESYNEALVEALLHHEIEVIAVTDHYRAGTAVGLVESAREAGIRALPGFEAVAKDGVHVLCLFDPSLDNGDLERFIGDCGIHDSAVTSPVGDYDSLELFERSREKWNAVCVAAHVAAKGGLLKKLKGTTGINAWTSPHLLACSLPGPVDDAPDELRPILKNKNADYKRGRPVAVINAQDVNGPDDLYNQGTSCWIKMSEISIEGLRQAFLDPESRIRLASDPVPGEHAEIVAVSWLSGFLDGQAIHFNNNLNVLIGGRGTGKSTVVESLRYALDLEPLGDEARKAHQGIIRQVLRNGTKISLLVRACRPAKKEYRIERTVPNPPVVRDEQGQVLNLTPGDIVPGMEVYGQHEISELASRPEKRTMLLERFIEREPSLGTRKMELRRELKRTQKTIIELGSEIQQIEDRLATLPSLEETLCRFQEAGLEDKLKERSLLVREERILRSVSERMSPFRESLDQLQRELPIDRTFLSPGALGDLPGAAILNQADAVLEEFGSQLQGCVERISEAMESADRKVAVVQKKWAERKRGVQAGYEEILRQLQKASVDGEAFIRLRGQIEELRPLKERQMALKRDLDEIEQRRRNLLAEWSDAVGVEYRHFERAAKKVNKQLKGRVRVTVKFAGNREPRLELLKNEVGGRLAEAIEVLRGRTDLSLKELAEDMREGCMALQRKYSIPKTQADRLAGTEPGVIMQIEELDLTATTTIELNIAGEDQPHEWRQLEELSKGQKATAVLLLLLLESEAPLIIDQPEDDLDNRFITEGVVPRMREQKRRRQFVFATHNANIPVLGDAELIAGLEASGEAAQGSALIRPLQMGSMDSRAVRELVEEILEGGRTAFETRRLKYGF